MHEKHGKQRAGPWSPLQGGGGGHGKGAPSPFSNPPPPQVNVLERRDPGMLAFTAGQDNGNGTGFASTLPSQQTITASPSDGHSRALGWGWGGG